MSPPVTDGWQEVGQGKAECSTVGVTPVPVPVIRRRGPLRPTDVVCFGCGCRNDPGFLPLVTSPTGCEGGRRQSGPRSDSGLREDERFWVSPQSPECPRPGREFRRAGPRLSHSPVGPTVPGRVPGLSLPDPVPLCPHPPEPSPGSTGVRRPLVGVRCRRTRPLG